MSGVPQGSVSGQVLFSISINDIGREIECTLSRFADDMKLSGVIVTREGWDVTQGDLRGQAQKWAHKNLIRFNKSKSKMLHLVQGNLRYEYRLGEEAIESSPVEKDLGILMDKNLDVSWQFAPVAQKANCILDCIKREGQQVKGEDSPPPLYSHETPTGVLHPGLEPSAQERCGPVRPGQNSTQHHSVHQSLSGLLK
ncbi:rna-directed dna polymerase from mobile element jockey-like [Pitangus sulphuratus]|nr:rna-directed dna polymerase from mobile element jockey-like [Pitangus sulphuratus]